MVFESLGSQRRAHPGVAKRAFTRLEPLESREVPALVIQPVSPQALVQNLVGAGVKPMNVTYQGTAVSSALFSGGTGIIGFESGIVLSSGRASDTVGPNRAGQTTTVLNTPGDNQLTGAAAGTPTFDATVLEFDYVPITDTISIQYVFGSEEYNEIVNFLIPFPDVCGIFVNGQNVALLPDGSSVNINNVNGGNPATTGTGARNSQFFRNNSLVDPGPATIDTEMDGLTVVLTATARVRPGQVNHVKIAVADGGDNTGDANIFVRAGSLAAGQFTGRVVSPLRFLYDPRTDTYRGNLTVFNLASEAARGPLHLVFPAFPPGVRLLNGSGVTQAGARVLTVNVAELAPRGVVRVPVVFANPNRVSLTTFFQTFPVNVVQGAIPQ